MESERMVLKIAILAEKYATDYQWYIDVIFKLLTAAGDYVSEDVWHRVVQIITNHENLQAYAAEKVLGLLQSPPIHESMVKVSGYILGEFGHLIEQSKASGTEQFDTLYKHFQSCSQDTKALLLSTFMKFINMYDDLSDRILSVFKSPMALITAFSFGAMFLLPKLQPMIEEEKKRQQEENERQEAVNNK